MRRTIASCLIILYISSPALGQGGEGHEEDDYTKGYEEGRSIGREGANLGTWPIIGCLGGFGLGLIGCGIVTGVAAGLEPDIPEGAMLEKGEAWQSGFRDGYSRGVKNRRIQGALMGGAFGTIATVIVFVAIISPKMQ